MHTAMPLACWEASQDREAFGGRAHLHCMHPGNQATQQLYSGAVLPFPAATDNLNRAVPSAFGSGLSLACSCGLWGTNKQPQAAATSGRATQTGILQLLGRLLKGQQPRNGQWWDKALPEVSPPSCAESNTVFWIN